MPQSRQQGQPAAEPVTVEVEVTEIDGTNTRNERPQPTPQPTGRRNNHWTAGWGGRVRTLDARWWPLWLLLGIVALVLVLTVGLVLAIFYLAFRIVLGAVRAIGGLFAGNPAPATRSSHHIKRHDPRDH
jgi:hypothetical protein